MTESPQRRLETDLRAAMKARDRSRVAVLRLLLAAVENRRIELGETLSEKDFLALVRKAVKQRHDSAELFRKGGRDELADKEESDVSLLEAYLPEQVDEATLRQTVAGYIAAEELQGPQAMGQVMKAMMAQFEGADGKTVSAIARELLATEPPATD